jgi:alpha-1,3-rhamnosyl/mannosyltransferase
MTPIRLALNAWLLMSTHTGIAAYTRNLAMALLERSDIEPLFFYGFSWSEALRAAPVPGIDPLKAVVKRLIPRPYALMRFAQQRCFDGGARRYHFDLYHEPSYLPFRFVGPVVITIHDLSPLRYPETHPQQRVQTVTEQLPRAVERAAAIIVDSEAVRREVIETLGVSPERVNTIHLGVSAEYRPRPAEEAGPCLARYRLGYGQYVLAVGTLEPRKNLVAALDAYMALPETLRKSTPMVIAGMRGWLSAELEARIRIHEQRGEVRWLGYVPAEDLPVLYSGATLLVYPSRYEGFGLPVLEAMASGIPVITSNQSSLPEVAGDAGIMVDPEDVDGLREQMLRLIEDRDEASRRGALGIERAKMFTWQACAEKTVAVYKQVMSKQ